MYNPNSLVINNCWEDGIFPKIFNHLLCLGSVHVQEGCLLPVTELRRSRAMTWPPAAEDPHSNRNMIKLHDVSTHILALTFVCILFKKSYFHLLVNSCVYLLYGFAQINVSVR